MIKVNMSDIEVIGTTGDVIAEVGHLVSSLEIQLGKIYGKSMARELLDASIEAGRMRAESHSREGNVK